MSQMMADSKITKTSDPIYNQIKDSYLNKGTLKTMKNIVHHHGLLGLYSGYGLHLGKPISFLLQIHVIRL